MYAGWKVLYGCEEWGDCDYNLTEEEAKKKYQEYIEKPPMLGGYSADYFILENDKSETITSEEL